MALADFDRDGDLDAVVASMEEPYKLYRNNSQSPLLSPSGWLEIRKINGGRVDGSNHHRTWFSLANLIIFPGLCISQFSVLHFGLGKAEEIKEVKSPGRLEKCRNFPI